MNSQIQRGELEHVEVQTKKKRKKESLYKGTRSGYRDFLNKKMAKAAKNRRKNEEKIVSVRSNTARV